MTEAATETNETKKPQVDYLFHAFVTTADGPKVVTGKRKTELQARINELGVDTDLIGIVKGRKVTFAETKQLTLM